MLKLLKSSGIILDKCGLAAKIIRFAQPFNYNDPVLDSTKRD